MSLFEIMLKKASAEPKNITVNVECIASGVVQQSIDCGTDKEKANNLEDKLNATNDHEKFFVYQSVKV